MAGLRDLGGRRALVTGASGGLGTSIEQQLGPLDILINNAGIEIASSFTRYTQAEIEAALSLDLLAPLRLTQLVLPGMLARGIGHVVTARCAGGHRHASADPSVPGNRCPGTPNG